MLTNKKNMVSALQWANAEIKSLRVELETAQTKLNAYERVLTALENAAPSKRSEMGNYDDKLFTLQDTIRELENEILGDYNGKEKTHSQE